MEKLKIKNSASTLGRAASSPSTGLYTPRGFIDHAVSLRQAFAHCAKFPVAADRSRMFRISVTLWGIMLSHPLPVIALVSLYLTN